jgi:hypothetical protein
MSDSASGRIEHQMQRRKVRKLVVFALLLMYPAVSQRSLAFFLCRTVNGTSYLVGDFKLRCDTPQWDQYLPLAIVALFVYPIGLYPFLFACWMLVSFTHRSPSFGGCQVFL